MRSLSTNVQLLKKEILMLSNPEKAKLYQRFFKTGKGEYGEGDVFVGLTVPQSRIIAKAYNDLSLTELDQLIKSSFHEERFISLLILVEKAKRSSTLEFEKIFTFYLKHTQWINNWDLVDVSAEYIVGRYLDGKSIEVLVNLTQSASLWERRIAMISTFFYIKKGRSEEALHIAALLLKDKHDLIHKAVGWMLREVGKKCSTKVLEQYLDTHAHEMPRTMLRYSIEHFNAQQRAYYLARKKNTISS